MDCNTRNCVYVIKCKGCEKLYIGETNNLRLRTNLHKSHVNKNEGLYVNKHIASCNQNIPLPRFNIMPFYKVKQDDEKSERIWNHISSKNSNLN